MPAQNERRKTDLEILDRFDKFIDAFSKKAEIDNTFFKNTVEHMSEETGQLDKIDGRMTNIENDMRDLKQQLVLDKQKAFDGMPDAHHVAHHHKLEEWFKRQDEQARLDQEGKTHLKWQWIDRIGIWIIGALIILIQLSNSGFVQHKVDVQKEIVNKLEKIEKTITPIP